MTNEEILKKVIEKCANRQMDIQTKKYFNKIIEEGTYYTLIFSHDFAKKFFGEEIRPEVNLNGTQIGNIPIWKINLQQMILEENPLKYLEQFLDK
jgi:hypothetical protein